MEQKTNKKKTLTKLYILAVLAILCLVYFLVPSVNAYVNQVASVLGSANVDTVVAFIRSYGAYAMAFSFALMVFQSAIAPLPAFLITFANAAIFGWWQGAILSWTSSMAGAALCFYLARALGLEAWGVAADGQNYRGQTMRDLREILARDKDVLWAIFQPEPTYLGDPEPLTGTP